MPDCDGPDQPDEEAEQHPEDRIRPRHRTFDEDAGRGLTASPEHTQDQHLR